jgi:hypothetical protein
MPTIRVRAAKTMRRKPSPVGVCSNCRSVFVKLTVTFAEWQALVANDGSEKRSGAVYKTAPALLFEGFSR